MENQKVNRLTMNFSAYFERDETRTPLSDQLCEKSMECSKQLQNLKIEAVLPLEGGSKLMVFVRPDAVLNPLDVLQHLDPFTPEIIISTENDEEFVFQYLGY